MIFGLKNALSGCWWTPEAVGEAKPPGALVEPGPAFGVISMLCIIYCLPFGAAAGAPVAVPCSFLYLLKSKDFPTAAVWWCCVVYGYTACFAPTGLIPR